jgi:FeS assembly SUF system regulator
MLRMSKLADYAFVILAQMTQRPEENWSASNLANETTLPLPTVAKLMKLLARSGIVVAQRGASGGYRLAHPVPEISITNIIEAVDGPIALTECAGKVKGQGCGCAVQSDCPVRDSWDRINSAVRSALNTVYLSDLAVAESSN